MRSSLHHDEYGPVSLKRRRGRSKAPSFRSLLRRSVFLVAIDCNGPPRMADWRDYCRTRRTAVAAASCM